MTRFVLPLAAALSLCVSFVACGGAGGADDDGGSGSTASGAPGSGAGGGPGSASGGGDAATTAAGPGASTSGVGGSGSGGGGAGATGGTGAGGAPMGSGGAGGSTPQGLASLGTLVVLGDSIGDGGGQPPFYYNLLKDDLAAKYGPIAYHNVAQSGSKTGALKGQIADLPSSLPGPVAVVITSGGNDMKDALFQILLGTDGPAKTTMQKNIDEALDSLLVPGKLGAGVEVHVFEANIYDASDGAGDFGSHGCAFGDGLPAIPSDAFFDSWNAVIAGEVASHGQVLADIHDHFAGHGYSGNPSWYAGDCTHPNSLGHDQLRRLFYFLITGEELP